VLTPQAGFLGAHKATLAFLRTGVLSGGELPLIDPFAGMNDLVQHVSMK
jgi:hypothetical protein